MAEQKKPEVSREENVEQVGPYQLQEQVAQEESSRGDLYRATHETSGATALVLKPAPEDEKSSERLSDWRVRVISSASHSYFALEVEHTPMSVAPDTHSVESLVCTLEEVRKGVGRMEQALHASNASRPWWRLALSGTVALVVALLPAALAPVAEGRVQEEAPEEAWATDVHLDPVSGSSDEAPRPVKNQKRAPCTEGLEVEVSGACWLPIEKRPCPPQTRAYQGQCLLPVAVPRPPVTSLDGGGGSEPR